LEADEEEIAVSLPIRMDRKWLVELMRHIEKDADWSTWDQFRLALEATQAQVVPHFDTLQCLQHLHGFEPLPHQIETTRRVIGEMRGRAILADEVGLGKTIEAGLILKEYLLRGLVKKVLILVPSSLVLQWTRELNQKFQIPAMAQKKEWMWEKYDILVASIDTAKRDPHRSIVLSHRYDMLIVDEAHKLKNRRTKNWQFINDLQKKYCLLLTATPVQNQLDELYNLVTLLKPGHLGRQSTFQTEHMASKRRAKNPEQLREEIHRVMIRNKRSDSNLSFTRRHVYTVPIQLSSEERALYEGVTSFVRDRYREGRGNLKTLLSLLVLQREVCSSRDAVFLTLFKLFQRGEKGRETVSPEVQHLIDLLRAVKEQSKVKKVVEMLSNSDEKWIIFTEYRATQEMIMRALAEKGISAIPYRGGFQRNKKDWMMELFQKRAQVMVATEAGGEGINLQFCHHIINYDMPWNPMRVEQRIGRVHRLGQTHDVHIYNFSTENTIEEHIIWLLHEKIDMFQSVIGDLETILERLDMKDSMEQKMMQIVIEAKDDREIRERFGQIGDSIHHARSRSGDRTLRQQEDSDHESTTSAQLR
jgi:SNF2 family DNA or RNA helicase